MLKGLTLLAASNFSETVKNHITAYTLLAVAAVFGLFALGFGLSATQSALVTHYGYSASFAGLIVAGTLFVIAAIIAIAAFIVKNRKVEPSPLTATALIAAPTAARLAFSRMNIGTIAVLAIVAGGAMLGRGLMKD